MNNVLRASLISPVPDVNSSRIVLSRSRSNNLQSPLLACGISESKSKIEACRHSLLTWFRSMRSGELSQVIAFLFPRRNKATPCPAI